MSVDMQSVEISQLFSAGFACDLEGVEHRKTLPCLSVVQALHGYYEIGLDHKALVSTGQGGAFIAPANCFSGLSTTREASTSCARIGCRCTCG